jgi:hypothetical protein
MAVVTVVESRPGTSPTGPTHHRSGSRPRSAHRGLRRRVRGFRPGERPEKLWRLERRPVVLGQQRWAAWLTKQELGDRLPEQFHDVVASTGFR